MNGVASRPTVVAVAGDPGGAAALAPVVRALLDEGRYRVIPCAYAQAVSLWQSQGIAAIEAGGLAAALADADLLLAATSVNAENLELDAVAWAQSKGIPSLAVLDFWSNYRRRFLADGRRVLADRLAVMDELARREMVDEGFPADRLVVTGQPAFDRLALAHDRFTPQRRSALRSGIGVEADARLVLFVSQPFADIHGSPEAARAALGFDEHEVLTLACAALSSLAHAHNVPIVLALRPHPREPDDKFAEIQEDDFRVAIWKTQDQLEAALSADLVLGMNSALLYEATLMGRPVVSLQPGLKGLDPLPSNRSGRSIAVYDPDKLRTVLEKLLFGPDRKSADGVSSGSLPPAGCATAAVVEEIRKLLGEA